MLIGTGFVQEGFPMNVRAMTVLSIRGVLLLLALGSGAHAAPTTLPVDQVGNVGTENAIARASDGMPIVSYIAAAPGDGPRSLRVVKCGTADCSTGNVITTVATSNVDGNGSIVVPPDGRPVLAYMQSGQGTVLKCGNATCSSGNAPVIVAGEDSPGVVVGADGFPIVITREGSVIRVTKCNDATCVSSSFSNLIVGQFGELAVALGTDGNPILATTTENVGLKVARCESPSCSGAVSFEFLDHFGLIRSKPVLMVPGDNVPIVAYMTGGSPANPFSFVRVARCRNVDCSDGATINQIASINGGTVAATLGADQRPLIAYQGLAAGSTIGMIVAKCGSATCAFDTTYTVIDSKPQTGVFCDIAIDGASRPIVSYFDSGNADLFVARCDNATCQGSSAERAPGQSNEPLAFVTGFNAAQVAVVDTVSQMLVSLIDVGAGPEGVAFSRDGQKAYVTNVSSGTVSFIDVRSRDVERTVSTGVGVTAPRGIAVSKDHARLYVANSGANEVAVIDRIGGVVESKVPVGQGPFGLAITPNGGTVIVANTNGDSASFISTSTNTLLGTIPVGDQPYGVATSPDGATAYVAVFGANAVAVIDVASRSVTSTIPVGFGPFAIAVSKDGTRLYVSDNTNRISVVDAVAKSMIDSIPVGSHPQGVALTPDGKYLFVANQFSDNVQVIDTATHTIAYTQAMPSEPVSLGAFISPPLVRARQAIEYYHAFMGHYFVTIEQVEIDALDSGTFPGWARTGQKFNVYDLNSGYLDTCRFFTTAFPPKGSHFYTPDAAECEWVKQNPDWTYEKIAYQLRKPVGGICPEGTIPLYRVYNNGITGAPNHRYTTSLAIRAQMISQGFAAEDDNTACIPPAE